MTRGEAPLIGAGQAPRVVRIYRTSGGTRAGLLGTAHRDPLWGWRFFPYAHNRRQSRRWHPTMEGCLPRWVGYPDSVEIEVVR